MSVDATGTPTAAAATEPPLAQDLPSPLLAPSAASPAPSLRANGTGWGLSELKPAFFNDSRFWALGISRVRLVVPWDLIPKWQAKAPGYAEKKKAVDEWLGAVQSHAIEAMVSFEHGLKNGTTTHGVPNESYLPTVPEYRRATQAFRRKYSWVQVYTAWNEPNHPSQPTAQNIKRAGEFWANLDYRCENKGPTMCVVAAGDFLDTKWYPNLMTAYRAGTGYSPPIWAWHAYSDGQDQVAGATTPVSSATRLRRFLSRLPKYRTSTGSTAAPRVWLTEQGGEVHDRCGNFAPASGSCLDQARDDLLRILGLPGVSNQITRLYVYQWIGDPAADTPPGSNPDHFWDSGLLDWRTNKTRQMYCDLMAMSKPQPCTPGQ